MNVCSEYNFCTTTTPCRQVSTITTSPIHGVRHKAALALQQCCTYRLALCWYDNILVCHCWTNSNVDWPLGVMNWPCISTAGKLHSSPNVPLTEGCIASDYTHSFAGPNGCSEAESDAAVKYSCQAMKMVASTLQKNSPAHCLRHLASVLSSVPSSGGSTIAMKRPYGN